MKGGAGNRFILLCLAFISVLQFDCLAIASSPPRPIRFEKRRGFNEANEKHIKSRRLPVSRRLERSGLEVRQSFDDDTVHQILQNEGILYLANVTVGTPPQSMELQIDTASSDIWVLSTSTVECVDQEIGRKYHAGCTHGTYDHEASSTYKLLEKDRFRISYIDGSGAIGDYITETFSVGNATIQGMQMGVAHSSNISYGIMGVGFEADQASTVAGGSGSYPNLVNEMVSQGLINSKAFSLWLDDIDSDTGSILFGGIDTARFIGPLTTIPLQMAIGQTTPTTFSIPLTSLELIVESTNYNITSKKLPATVILDSGTSLTYLPPMIASSIATYLNAKISSQLGFYIINCSHPTDNSYMTYTFSYSASIRVPLSELILPLTDYSGRAITDAYGDDVCSLGILPSHDVDEYLFGDTFLRSVYDLDNARVAIAQTEFDPVEANIIEIEAGENGIPNVGFAAPTIMGTTTHTGHGSRVTHETGSNGSSSLRGNIWALRDLCIVLALVLFLAF